MSLRMQITFSVPQSHRHSISMRPLCGTRATAVNIPNRWPTKACVAAFTSVIGPGLLRQRAQSDLEDMPDNLGEVRLHATSLLTQRGLEHLELLMEFFWKTNDERLCHTCILVEVAAKSKLLGSTQVLTA